MSDSIFRVVVVGASMGGVEALIRLVRALPQDLHAALFVVQHMGPSQESRLPEILSRHSPLPVQRAVNGQPIVPGNITVAVPGVHLKISNPKVVLDAGPRQNGFRPAIDTTLLSAAYHFGPRAVGVLLTGALSDGVAGMMAVRNAGGVTIVQDPRDAFAPELPQQAIDLAGADYVLPVEGMPALLAALAATPLPEQRSWPIPADLGEVVERYAEEAKTFSCPECGGVLLQVDNKPLLYRCQTGHTYAGERLLSQQTEKVETALWTAIRIFREQAILSERIAESEREAGREVQAVHFEERAQVANQHADAIQGLLGAPES